jgi:signal transduction histidine kinase
VLHELRNPLAAVTSMLEVIVEETCGDLQTDLHSLLWELRRMSLNLHGVSGIARPLRAKAYAAIDHAVREACRVLEATAACKGVNVLCEVDDLPLLPLDRGALSGIVFNLVTNAIDACSRGNQVIVRLSLDENGALSLSVQDDGKGMKPETLARCCELFFTEKDGGTGIGLALCKEAIAAAGGSLDVRSALGHGTTVNVSIPFTQHDRRR